MKPLLSLLFVLFTLAACATPPPRYHVPADQVATAILAPVANWNPVPGQHSHPGSAAYGRVNVNNGYIDSQQTFEAWTSAGEPVPQGIVERRAQQQYQQARREQYYQQYPQPRIRYCYNSYTNRQERC